MKTSRTLIIPKITLLFICLVLFAIKNVSAQVKVVDKKTVDKVISPQTSQLIYNSLIDKAIKSDLNGGDNFYKKNLGIERGNSETLAIENSSRVGSFYVSRKDLIDFLYDSGKINPNLIGINIWFTKNNNQIAIAKAISNTDSTFEDQNSDYKLLISKPLSKNTGLKSSFVSTRTSISETKNNNIPIHGYFVGRSALMTKIINADDSINSSYAGFEFIVREKNNQKFICFYAVKNIKNKEFFGLAKFEETVVSSPSTKVVLDKMGGSRPCPPYCRKD
jgi:hypothetical protein